MIKESLISRLTLGLAAGVALVGCNITDPPPQADATWCDVTIDKCNVFNRDFSGNIISCDHWDPTKITTSHGQKRCFDSATQAPSNACQGICSQLRLADPIDYPSGCTAAVNTSPAPEHPAEYYPNFFIPQACTSTNEASYPLVSEAAGTNTVVLGGNATLSFGGSSASVTVSTGFFNIAAPKTSCASNDTSCPVQLNQTEITFGDFTLGGKLVQKLTITSREHTLTGSGQFVASGSGNRFIFTIPMGVVFDAVATVDGQPQGTNLASNYAVFGSLDLATGEVAFQFSLAGTFYGTPFSADGVATTASVIGQAPVVSALASVSADATVSCTAPVNLQATVTSPSGLPLTTRYVVDNALVSSSAAANIALGIGSHTAQIVAWDIYGETTTFDQTITVNDKTPPVFSSFPTSVSVNSCSNAASPIAVTVPTASSQCSASADNVTGEVIQYNGAAVSIPVVNGTVNVPPGSGTIRYTATGPNGTLPVDQSITVQPPAPVFNNVPTTVLLNSCSNAASAIAVAVPTASSPCLGGTINVTGQVIQYNGAAASIPVVNGTINVPPGSGTIRYTANGPNGPETVDQAITVQAPALLYGKNGITVSADGAIVNGTVLSGASGLVSIGNDSATGNVFSLSPVRLFDRSTTGIIQTSAAVTQGFNDHILGIVRTTPTLSAFPSLLASFTSSTAVTVAPDGKQTLAPGQFGKVTVYSRAQLTLGAGDYDFTGLDLEPQAHLVVPANVENVRIFIRDNVVYRGTTNLSSGAVAPVYLGFAGTAPVVLESAFVGTVVAPNAQLTLQTVSSPHVGEFFAKQVNVAAHTTVNSNAFSCH